jgi:ATP-dependent RNA helicase DeaD
MAPTRELALQVSEAMTAFGQFCKAQVLAVYGGAAYARQISQLRRGVDVVVGTPGRLLDMSNRGILDLSQVRTVVLDEADEMLSMGFIEDIEAILAATPAERQTALFSATMPTEIRRLADKYMRAPQSVTIQREQVTVPAIEQRYYLINEREKTAALTRLFEMEEISSALIFVRTRAGTGELSNELATRGFPSEALNGDLSQEARERTLNRFRAGQIKVLVATSRRFAASSPLLRLPGRVPQTWGVCGALSRERPQSLHRKVQRSLVRRGRSLARKINRILLGGAAHKWRRHTESCEAAPLHADAQTRRDTSHETKDQ